MVCAHRSYKEVYKFEAATLYKCDECKLIFSDKIRQDFDSKKLYEKYYTDEVASRFNIIVEYMVRFFRFFRAFKIFTVSPKANSILDVGSGRGFMLYYLKNYYKYQRTSGTQISKNAFEFSRNKLGLEVYNQDLLELNFDNFSFDIITIWQVLEHIKEPERYIEKAFSLLNSRGALIIEVPNFNSWSRALTNKYWLGLDLEYHLNFFTPESLTALLKKYNFKIKTIRTFSLEYSTFLSVQSLVSLFTKSEHLFFRYLQTIKSYPWFVLHIFLFILLTPVCFLVNLFLFFSKKGEVLFIVAEKKLKSTSRFY